MNDTLDLVLTHHWFDMIRYDGKREEYRADTEYYRKRLTELKTPLLPSHRNGSKSVPYKPFKYVRLHRGYTSNTMKWEVAGMYFGYGKKEWGAPDEPVHVIRLGNCVDYSIAA